MLLNFFQKLDNALSYLFSNSINEKRFLKSFFLNKKIVFVDIGANVGSYSDLLINNLNIKNGYLFEPSIASYKILRKKFNKKEIKVYNYAISNSTQKKRIFYEYNLSSQSSLYEQNDFFDSFNELNKKIIVKSKKIDDILPRSRIIDICKIDVQGEELNVLKSMKYFLKKKLIKLLKIEINFYETYKNTEVDYIKIINFMEKYGYKLTTISKIKYKNNKVIFLDAYFALKSSDRNLV